MGISGGPEIVREDVSLAIDAGDRTSFVTGSTIVRDLSSNNIVGSLQNNPGFTTDNRGAMIFNGSNTSMTMPTSTQLGNSNYSIEFALLVSATSLNYGIMIWGSSPFNTGGQGIEMRFQTNQFEYTLNDGTGTGTRLQHTFSNIADGWYRHFILTQQRQGTAILYVDGRQVATQNYSGESTFNNINNILLGRGNDGFLNGRIANFRIYTRALSPREVRQNYNSIRSRFNLS
jgi:hypothetical protein